MHRNSLLDKLARYIPIDAQDAAQRDRIVEFVRQQPRCFERSLDIGHITGSGWLVDAANERVLLTHHAKLHKWLQLGGHADGDPDVLRVALREAEEESGLGGIVPLSEDIFDLDVHPIPAHGGTPAHLHYDIRFILQASNGGEFVVTRESHELRWFTAEALAGFTVGASVMRMREKWLAFSRGNVAPMTGKARP